MLTAALALALTQQAENPYLNRIISDSTLPHEAAPQGVPESYNWAKKPRNGLGNHPPMDWKAFTAWGQVYNMAPKNPEPNVRVQLRNIQAWFLHRNTRKWELLQFSRDTDGAAYRNDFKDDANKPINRRKEEDGSSSVRLLDQYNYHFWPEGGRATIDPGDIAGIYVACQARLTPEDPDKSPDLSRVKILLSMGADYWKALDSEWDNFKTNNDATIGRFRFVSTGWGWHFATTLDAAELRRDPPPAPITQQQK